MSWFDQIDFTSIQDQLARSVEEASAVISTVNRLEMLNLDDMAAQQEEEEKRRLEEEEEEEEDDEEANDEPGVMNTINSSSAFPASEQHYASNSVSLRSANDLSVSSIDNLALESVVVTGSDIETGGDNQVNDSVIQPADDWSPIQSPPPKQITSEVSSAVKASGKKTKKKKSSKHKKKKKHLDFFGIRSAQDEEDEEEEALLALEEDSNNANAAKGKASNLESIFDISSLWDADGGIEEVPLDDTAASQTNHPASSSNHEANGHADGSQSSFMSEIFQSTSNALRVPVNIKIPSSAFSFFSNVDTEVDLDNDPILKKVEENRRSAERGGGAGGGMDYVAYFRALTGTTSAPSSALNAAVAPAIGNTGSAQRSASSHVTFISTGRRSGISSTSLANNEDVTLVFLSSQLCENLQTTTSTFAENLRTVYTQFIAIASACQLTNVGSVLLHSTSMMYIFAQLLSVVVMYILRVIMHLAVFLMEVLVMGFRAVLNMRQERLELPCSVRNFQQRREWVRENVGAWANRVCEGANRVNYLVVVAISIVLIFMFWKLQEYLDIE